MRTVPTRKRKPMPERARGASWQRKYVQHAAHAGLGRQVAHGIREPQSGRAVARVDASTDNRSRPSADAGQHSHILFAIGPTIGNGLTYDPRAGFEAPQ